MLFDRIAVDNYKKKSIINSELIAIKRAVLYKKRFDDNTADKGCLTEDFDDNLLKKNLVFG